MTGKPTRVRFYIDEDLLGLALVVAALRADVTYPGDPGHTVNKRVRPPCMVTRRGAPDDQWIPTVTRQQWLIITRDKRIQDRPMEIAAVRDYGARMVNLSSPDATTKWGQLEVLMSRWRDIERLSDRAGPSSSQ